MDIYFIFSTSMASLYFKNLINFFRFPENVLNVREYQDYIALYIFYHLLPFESYVFQIT